MVLSALFGLMESPSSRSRKAACVLKSQWLNSRPLLPLQSLSESFEELGGAVLAAVAQEWLIASLLNANLSSGASGPSGRHAVVDDEVEWGGRG